MHIRTKQIAALSNAEVRYHAVSVIADSPCGENGLGAREENVGEREAGRTFWMASIADIVVRSGVGLRQRVTLQRRGMTHRW